MTGLVSGNEFTRAIRSCRALVFRLETLQEYRNSGEDEWIAAFERGDAVPPPDPVQDDWEDMIRRMTAAGVLFERVHVVTEPLTSYMRFELAWAYPPNARAGEHIRVADGTRSWPAGVPRQEFWILDTQHYDAVYEQDGTWLGVRPVEMGSAPTWRAAAVAASVPLDDYLAQRPRVAARVVGGR